MTTTYSSQKKPYPDETHTATIDRILAAYAASERRRIWRRRIGVACLYLAAGEVIVGGLYYLLK